MRRLALVAGVFGASFGVYVSYVQVNTLLAQRTRHNDFISLLSAPAVQRDLRLRGV
jgi:hypothetical protein